MLTDFYEENQVPAADRVPLEKNIVLTVPERGFDVDEVLGRLGLSPWEVATVWPKKSVGMLDEISAIRPKMVVQVGRRFFKKFPFVKADGDWCDQFEDRVKDVVTDNFVGLHHHDDFSLKDGLGTVKQLVQILKAQRRSFCCVTNHGSVGGWVRQYNACRDAGVKAIFGMEAYVSNYRGDDKELKKAHRRANHLIVLAVSEQGFYNVIKIHNDAQINGFYYSPRTNWEACEEWGKGVVGTSACLAGEIPRALEEGDEKAAEAAYRHYSKAFDRFYVEIQMIEYPHQQEMNRRLIQFARRMEAPLIMACDSHYLEAEQSETHDLLMCVRQNKTILDKKEQDDLWIFDVKNLYYRNHAQMRDLFDHGYSDEEGHHPPFSDPVFTEEVFREAMDNTRAVALMAEDIELDDSVKLPKLYDNGEAMLKKKVNEGFKRRGFNQHRDKKAYVERVNYEFKVIVKLGWPDYFLVMDRIIGVAREVAEEMGLLPEWAIGYGRGSAAGSLVSYCLGLTEVDPIEHGLLFERFLDEGRPDPPDIDTDFDPRIRDRVKERIIEMFGEDNVCSIGTYSSYKTSSVILDVARALGKNVVEAQAVTKKMDPLKQFEDEEGQEHKVDDLSFDELEEHYPELKMYFANNEDVRYHAEILRNQVKNMSKHAGGVIISDVSLKGRIPVLWDKASSDDRQVMSAWAEGQEKSELSAVGLVKFDLLGLNNLPVISDCVQLVKSNQDIVLKREDIPIDDKESIKMGSKDDLVGIFQLENPATKPVVEAVGMESLADVSAITSLIRPGPRDMEMDMEYAHRKNGKPFEVVKCLEPIMAETYGVMTYQEQMMQISKVLCGFDGPMANKLRKACGKKIVSMMESIREKFVDGAQPRIHAGEVTLKQVEDIWDLIAAFARYSFNKSHAVTYSAISTVEMWLKYNYPMEYMTALVNNTKLGKKKHGYDVFVHYLNYARRRQMDVKGPDISASKSRFDIQAGAIRFSLAHVKNVASQAPVIESFQPILSVEDFHERVKVTTTGTTGRTSSRRPNKKVVESLVAGGAFDRFGTRNEVMTEYYRCRKNKKETPPQYTDDEWVEKEREVLGLCLSRPPLYQEYTEVIRDNGWLLVSQAQADDTKKVKVFGQIQSVKSHTSRKGSSMYVVHMTDGLDTMKFYVFLGGQQAFRDNFKVDTIGAVPMSRFDDGGMRFFDDRGKCEVLSTKKVAPGTPVRIQGVTNRRDFFTLTDGSVLTFTDGATNEYYVSYDVTKTAEVTDAHQLGGAEDWLYCVKAMADEYGADRVDADLSEIWKVTTATEQPSVFERVREISEAHSQDDRLFVEVIYSWAYATLVAQQNLDAPLKKGSLRLAWTQVLGGMEPGEAAAWQRRDTGRTVDEMMEECKKHGF